MTTATATNEKHYLLINFKGCVDPFDLTTEQKAIVDAYPDQMNRKQSKQLKAWLLDAIAAKFANNGVKYRITEYSPSEFTLYFSYKVAIDVAEYLENDPRLTANCCLRRLPGIHELDPLQDKYNDPTAKLVNTEGLGDHKLVPYS